MTFNNWTRTTIAVERAQLLFMMRSDAIDKVLEVRLLYAASEVTRLIVVDIGRDILSVNTDIIAEISLKDEKVNSVSVNSCIDLKSSKRFKAELLDILENELTAIQELQKG